MLSVLEVLKKTSEFFAAKGIDSPRLNAELLVGHALALPRMRLYLEFERPVSDPELAAIRELVRRRGRREPLQYVLGTAEFGGLRLKTDPRALIPRPETEFLVETAVARSTASPDRVLDLGTGSGAIALALAAAFPLARVTAVDASAEALALAAENAAAPEVRDFEPRAALEAPADGFADLAAIIAGAPGRLAAGGLLALETGTGHHARAAEAATQAGFGRSESLPDLAGRDRIFLAWR